MGQLALSDDVVPGTLAPSPPVWISCSPVHCPGRLGSGGLLGLSHCEGKDKTWHGGCLVLLGLVPARLGCCSVFQDPICRDLTCGKRVIFGLNCLPPKAPPLPSPYASSSVLVVYSLLLFFCDTPKPLPTVPSAVSLSVSPGTCIPIVEVEP